jgi:glycosyltransferase involved in cell wall biosynthesis
MNSPFFSVIIPLYNRANIISKAIISVLNQTFQDFELIIVDDCSSDASIDVVKKYQEQDSRIKLLVNEKNQERCISRNRGIEESQGKYICFLDSDDEFLTFHLQLIYDKIVSSWIKKALFFTNAFQTDNFEKLQERICPKLDGYNLFEYILIYTFNPARVAIHYEILNEFKFDNKIPGIEDLDLWLHIASKFPIIQIEDRTIIYNIHNESYTVAAPNRYKRELLYFKYVFSKETIKKLLPVKAKNRLLSMCHYNYSVALSGSFYPFKIHYHIVRAFLLYPKGYNINSNKTMLIIFLDQIPIVGYLFKLTRKITKIVIDYIMIE